MDCSIVTPRVMNWIAGSRPARVLNLFDEVCSLVDDAGSVISLVSPAIGPGPFAMVLEGNFTRGVHAESPITVDPQSRSLTIGPYKIETDTAELWNPIPDWQALKSMALPYQSDTPRLSENIQGPLSQLVQGIRQGDQTACSFAVSYLAGLGGGLTPAGDDILMGVLYAMWVWLPQRELMHEIVNTAVPRTTTLSAAFLRAAADGEATIHWHDLANGRAGAIDQILAIGASSGRDAWKGFTTAGRQFAA